MRHYLVSLGHGIRRNVIAASAFEAIRHALGTLTLDEQMIVTVDQIRIKAEPVRRTT